MTRFMRTWRFAALGALTAAFYACSESATETVDFGDPEPELDVTGTPNKQFWKQCKNNHDYADECDWVTGNLNHSHNTYAEGDFVPKVLRINGINSIDPFEIVMTYGFLKGGLTTHDFLGQWDETMTNANPCTDGSFDVFCDAGGVLADIDAISNSMAVLSQNAANTACSARPQMIADMAEAIADAGAGLLVIEGINVDDIDVTNIVFDGCPVSGDAEAFLTMTVTPLPDALGSEGILLLFGAHVAKSPVWDNGGAAGVSGSPYHLGLVTVDGKSAGSMDLQMSANAIVAQPELVIVKTAENATITAGDVARFTITLTNNGLGTAVGATINDPLPAGLDWSLDSFSPDPTAACAITGAVGTEVLDCGPLDLAQGASITATVSATTSPAACATYNNTAFGEAADHDPVDDDASIACQTPVLQIVKTAENATITAGDDARFTITLTNNGPGTAAGATIDDALPADLDWSVDSFSPDPGAACAITGAVGSQELDCGPLDLAEDASITVTVSATTSLAECGTYDNDAFGDADNAAQVDDDASITCQTPALKIAISPLTGTNSVADTHTLTATAMKDPEGDDTFVAVEDGVTITFAFETNTIGATFVGGTNTCLTAGGTGQCSVDITSTSAGQVEVSAAIALTIGSVTLNAKTGTGGDNSANATKDFLAGSLIWEKRADSPTGALIGGATFEVCRTRDYDPATDVFTTLGTEVCFSPDILDNNSPDQDADDGQFQLIDLILGTYRITETIAPTGYILDPTVRTVDVTSGTTAANGGVWVNLQTGDVCEDGKPRRLIMLYTGNGTANDNHTQAAGEVIIRVDDDLPLETGREDPVFTIRTYDHRDKVLDTFEDVEIGDLITFENTGKKLVPSRAGFRVFLTGADIDDKDAAVEHVQFHSSCSQPLAPGDEFGSFFLLRDEN